MSVNHITTYNFKSVSFSKCINTCFKYYWCKFLVLFNHLLFLINLFKCNISQKFVLIRMKFFHQLTYEKKDKLLNLLLRNAVANICECKEHILIKVKFSLLSKENYNIESKMTVIDTRFIEIREDHPALDAEIRGILLSRAQYGATINDIENDYRNLTGTSFPVKENVTEFLLTVPYVMVYCNENGKRLFNILPRDKTKHLLELVLHQKPQQQQQQQVQLQQKQWERRQQLYNNSTRINSYNNNNLYNNIPPYYKENSEHYNQCHQSNETLYRYLNNRLIDLQHHQQEHQQEQQQPQQQQSINTNSNWKMLKSYNNNTNEYQYNRKENTCFYQANCNYFNNRFCNNHLLRKPEQLAIPTNSQYLSNNLKASRVVSGNGSYASQDPNIKINHYQHQHHDYNDNDHYGNNQDITSTITATTNRDTLNHGNNIHTSPPTKSCHTIESRHIHNNYEAHLFNFLLLGDDFLLYMARMELGCKFKKDERVLQSGLCVSGQNIRAAINRIQQFNIYNRSIIINIGSVDITKGRQLIEMQHDFRELITALLKKNAKPILTTLAPLAIYAHDPNIKNIVLRFNEFIKCEAKSHQLIVVDIFACLVNDKEQTLFHCYQNAPRPVTGTRELYVFWNKIGRQRVLRLIESHLEY